MGHDHTLGPRLSSQPINCWAKSRREKSRVERVRATWLFLLFRPTAPKTRLSGLAKVANRESRDLIPGGLELHFLQAAGFPAFFEDALPKGDRAHRADQSAEQATDAFAFVAMRAPLFFVPAHRLVGSIVARDDATAAADAFIFVDGRIDDVVAVEVLGGDDVAVG